tara:strand:- start:1935 stop:2159 length:225 start_codon:yes stop_codon:yes gene_type:complete
MLRSPLQQGHLQMPVPRKGQKMAKKRVKAPAGFHWMKSGSSYNLMKHTGKFKPHKGASLFASFDIQKIHKAGKK